MTYVYNSGSQSAESPKGFEKIDGWALSSVSDPIKIVILTSLLYVDNAALVLYFENHYDMPLPTKESLVNQQTLKTFYD